MFQHYLRYLVSFLGYGNIPIPKNKTVLDPTADTVYPQIFSLSSMEGTSFPRRSSPEKCTWEKNRNSCVTPVPLPETAWRDGWLPRRPNRCRAGRTFRGSSASSATGRSWLCGEPGSRAFWKGTSTRSLAGRESPIRTERFDWSSSLERVSFRRTPWRSWASRARGVKVGLGGCLDC